MAIDDGPDTDRLAVLSGSGSGRVIDVFADEGTGPEREQHIANFDSAELTPITPIFPGSQDTVSTGQFNRPIALDGDRLAVIGRQFYLPKPDALPIIAASIVTFERAQTWHEESQLWLGTGALDPSIVTTSRPVSLTIAGDHMAVSVLKWLEPTAGCQCFGAFGTEAWSFDRL
ncbi:hypothetical protein BH10ACT3_BH10ACT3_19990 [soil metagenome]